jgi:hypothetical protein
MMTPINGRTTGYSVHYATALHKMGIRTKYDSDITKTYFII